MAKAKRGEIEGQIDYYLALAQEKANANATLAKRYVALARKLAMRHRIPLGRERKMKFCQKCGEAWVVGHNLKVRIRGREGKVEYMCRCGASRKFIYKAK